MNDTLSYKLHTGTEDFTIDGNGTITANIIFDREVYRRQCHYKIL